MGVHSGPVNEITDLNEQANIAGAGINMAQRVMDCGDAGHILLSKRVADDLAQYPRWRSFLHDLGECEVKHGVRIDVVNFYGDGIGNPQPPRQFQIPEASCPDSLDRRRRCAGDGWLTRISICANAKSGDGRAAKTKCAGSGGKHGQISCCAAV